MYWQNILKLKYNRIFAMLMTLVLILGTTVSFAALLENTYDLSYQDGDDPDTFYHWAEFDGVFWEVSRPEGSAGTGVFDSFLRIQSNGVEKGYNTNGPVEFDTKTGSWTHAITISEIPYGTATVDDITYSGFEFMIDINESTPKSIMKVDEYQFWLTGDPNLTDYLPTGEGPDTLWNIDNEEPVWIGEIDWDFGADAAIDRQLIMDYLVNSGSGAADYRVLIPEDYFFDALEKYNSREDYVDLDPETAYLVLYVEHSEADAGFEEWGVRVVEKGALTITKNFSGYPMGYVLPEVIVNVSNGMGYSQDVPLNMGNDWTATLSGLMPGDYTVTEYDVEGWTTSYPEGNTVEVIADTTSNIEIDNTFDRGYLKVTKEWTGYPEHEDFVLPTSISGTITGPFDFYEEFTITSGDGWEKTFGPLPPGEYTVTEDGTTGWTTTMDPSDGVVNVTAGEMAQAVSVGISNAFDEGYLKVTKEWTGYPEHEDFVLPTSISGTITGPF
ncbi:hypothetical protein, partial [Gudongella sp. DL1XJH-153]|uniref:hypothetical protein n=1 Tax=Gudongella sp. DL1XJH-153 TaxID=3409804 RepID=UPI003BB7E802